MTAAPGINNLEPAILVRGLRKTYGKIDAVHLQRAGASYTGRAEVFLKGRPLNVTGLDFGPDGAMYFVTGGRRKPAATSS